MNGAIATVSLPGELRAKLEAIAAAGFKAVEIFENDLTAFPDPPRTIRHMCQDLGLEIVAFQPFRDLEGAPVDRRANLFERLERKFDLMGELGCDLLLVCSSVAPDSSGLPDRLAADLREAGQRAAKRDMRIGYEALAGGCHVNDYVAAWDLVRRANHPNVGIILDAFHILARGTDTETIKSIPRERIFLVQVADAWRLDMDYLSSSRRWRCMPSQGDLDLTGFMGALASTGYNGYLSLEISNDRFRAGSAPAVAVDGRRSLTVLNDDTNRRIVGRARRPRLLPPRAPVRAVEFVEFAIQDADRLTFEGLLATLGFTMTGVHRSKAVTLWEQGRIRIVVNCEDKGFAGSYRLAHGASVCAIALRVPDPRATMMRASALLGASYSGAVGPGELEIPSIRGVGGSLIYFIDDNSRPGHWSRVDFLPTGNVPAGIGLVDIDHISQSMPYEEMLTWLLFYVSLFDARKVPSQAVIDPGGVVQNQIVQSGIGDTAQGGLRIVLNASQSGHTSLARFGSELSGSGVQHIAFATTDIFAVVNRLRGNGVEMLPIPSNCYDDLESRGLVGATEIERMRAHNILYDRDGDAEYLQVYAAARASGVLFEIVERRSYASVPDGAPNSDDSRSAAA